MLSAHTIQYPPFPDQTKTIEDPAKARIYLLRSNKFYGCAVGFILYGNSSAAAGPRVGAKSQMRLIGEVGPGSYLCWEEEPHPFVLEKIRGDTNSLYSINLAAGTVYDLRADILFGWTTPKLALTRISEEEGSLLLKDCKPPDDYRKGNQP